MFNIDNYTTSNKQNTIPCKNKSNASFYILCSKRYLWTQMCTVYTLFVVDYTEGKTTLLIFSLHGEKDKAYVKGG